MAKGIQDLGIGLGYLYKTLPDGATIVAVEKNTAEGVRSMKSQGVTNGPVIADRPAVGTIVVNSVAGVGSITAITIGGVNQLGANINVVSSTASVVATQIARAINGFAPGSGPDYTAEAIGATVKVFSPANVGSSVNGQTITVTVTDPSINTTTTPLNNGSSQNAVYDTTFGYRFYIDADYGAEGTPGAGTATPTSLLYAAEITQYMTLRGLQSGIFTTTATIASDSITGITRCSAITQILVSNQGGAPTDVLAFIGTEGFAVGDEIQLSSAAPGTQVPTLESAPVTTSPVGTPNIYLTSDSAFVMSSYTSITLQLRNVPGAGLAWIELGRSEVLNSVITRTISTMNADIVAGLVKPNALYHITDIGATGAYVQGLSATQISATGSMGRRVPKNSYNDTWRSNIAGGAVIGNYYRYCNNIYQSVTGVLGTAPPSSPNWNLITNNSFYITEYHTITLNLQEGVGIDPLWPFIEEKDSNNNVVRMSKDSFAELGINQFNIFPWCETGAPQVRDNTIDNSVFDVYQFTRPSDVVSGNLITSGTVFNTNNPKDGAACDFKNNVIATGIITNNRFAEFSKNTVISGTVNANSASSDGVTFIQNSVKYSTIQLCEHTSGATFSINDCVLEGQSSIGGCTLDTTGISQMILLAESTLGGTMINGTYEKWTLTGASQVSVSISPVISGGIFSENSFLSSLCSISWHVGGAVGNPDNIRYNTFTGTCALVFDSTNSTSVANQFDSCFVSNSTIVGTGLYSSFINCNSPNTSSSSAYSYNSQYVSPTESTVSYYLDLSDPAIYSAGVLTIPENAAFASTFVIISQIPRTISSIVRPNYQSDWPPIYTAALYPTPTFIIGGNVAPFATVTITTAVRATALGDEIIGDAASYTLNCVTGSTGLPYASDSITIRQIPRVQPTGGNYMYMVTNYNQYL